jgi:hypothetical protein
MTDLTTEQWQAEVERLESISKQKAGSGAKGFSSSDLAEHKGISNSRSTHIINKGVKAGIIRYSGRQQRINMIGSMQSIPVYEFVKPKR